MHAGSLRTLSILRILLSEGYHVTYLPVHDISSKLHVYATRARFLGVDVVTPITTPDSWSLLDKGGRLVESGYPHRGHHSTCSRIVFVNRGHKAYVHL